MGRKKKNIKTKKVKKIKKQPKILLKKMVTKSNFKSAADKIPIKKIKKQAVEKKIYNIKDFVVYPKRPKIDPSPNNKRQQHDTEICNRDIML